MIILDDNKSEEIVVNIKDFGAIGDGVNNDSIALRKAINYAKENHARVLFFPKGNYALYDKETELYHIHVEELLNIKFIGEDESQIIMKNPELGGFKFSNCRNLTIFNLTIDYYPLPFTQGTIVSLNKKENSFDFLKDSGFPNPTDYNYKNARRRGTLFYPNGDTNLDGGCFFIDKILPSVASKDENLFTFYRSADFTRWKDDLLKGLKVGYKFMLMARYTSSHAFLFVNSTNITLEKTTVYSAPTMAFVGACCDGVKIKKCIVGIKPGTSRLISTDAEPVHLASCRNNSNLIEGCKFNKMNDDAVNLNGRSLSIIQILDKNTVIVSQKIIGEFLYDSDILEVFDSKNNISKGTTTLLKYTRMINKEVGLPAKVKIWKLEFNKPLKNIKENDYIIDLNACSGNFIIRNNVFSSGMGMGIRIRSIDGLIEDNKIEYSGGPGIYIGGQLHACEGPNGKNITIQKNHIFHAGFGAFHSSIVNQGSVNVTCLNINCEKIKDSYYGNININILNNIIEESPRSGVYINNSMDVNITNNKIINPNYLNTQRMYIDELDKGIVPFSAIILDCSKNTTVNKNIFIDERGQTKRVVLKRSFAIDTHIDTDLKDSLKT